MKLFAIQRLFIVVIGLMLVCANSNAATERVVDYEYDGAGNIVRIITREQSAPPVISPLSPNFINQGQSRTITATGSNLLGVEVSTDTPGLSIDLIDAGESGISFQLTADSQATIGNAIIRFITGIGEVQQSIFVAEVGPKIITSPSPITIDLSATSNTVTLNFSVPRPEDETYSLSIVDPATATVDSASFNISTGASRADISLTGIAAGATVLQIDLPAKFYSYRFPVYVSETYAELLQSFPDMAERNLFAEPVGVVVPSNNPYLPNTVTSGPVGVLVDSNAATYAKPVGVLFGDATGGEVFSKPVGVIVSSSISYAYNAPVGTVYGPFLTGSQPTVAAKGATTIVEVSGFNLAEVVTVSLAPTDDIVVGSISTNPEGTLLTVSITVDPLATAGQRELILEDANGPISIGPGIPLTIDIQ
jgi:hypothetical protein